MSGLKIVCYGGQDECEYFCDGVCHRFDRQCNEIHIDAYLEDGEE